MKKTFCDSCGREMRYEDIPDYLKNGKGPVEVEFVSEVDKKTKHKIEVDKKTKHKIEVDKKTRHKIEVRVLFDFNPENGQHVDVCHHCRLQILDKLDTRPRVAN